jgi:L-lysine exporter family protein LysE/ArgO
METFIQGLLLQSSLILALGAQNLFVLDCGVRKRNPLLVAVTCGFCDLVLIILGVLGAAALFRAAPLVQPIIGAMSVLFLLYYGLLKLREGLRSSTVTQAVSDQSITLKATLIAALSFSLLNPHVYLDALVLIGGYSTKFPAVGERLLFGAGAASFSLIWFLSLAFGAAAISTYLKSAKVLRGLSLASGVVLIVLGFKLGTEALSWIQ